MGKWEHMTGKGGEKEVDICHVLGVYAYSEQMILEARVSLQGHW